jgi:hypothetical protein
MYNNPLPTIRAYIPEKHTNGMTQNVLIIRG